jgi:hypothetical protein
MKITSVSEVALDPSVKRRPIEKMKLENSVIGTSVPKQPSLV